GDPFRAREILMTAAADAPAGRGRNEILAHLGSLLSSMGEHRAGIEVLDDLLADPTLDDDLRAAAHTDLTWLTTCVGNVTDSLEHGRLGAETAARIGDQGILSGALSASAKAASQLGVPGALEMA